MPVFATHLFTTLPSVKLPPFYVRSRFYKDCVEDGVIGKSVLRITVCHHESCRVILRNGYNKTCVPVQNGHSQKDH